MVLDMLSKSQSPQIQRCTHACYEKSIFASPAYGSRREEIQTIQTSGAPRQVPHQVISIKPWFANGG